jgi:hypothetical protein
MVALEEGAMSDERGTPGGQGYRRMGEPRGLGPQHLPSGSLFARKQMKECSTGVITPSFTRMLSATTTPGSPSAVPGSSTAPEVTGVPHS